MEITSKQINEFQQHIFSWWEQNRRDLPWRNTRDPYKILISEVMLQQTQVSRVLQKYLEFIKEFPDIQAFASAPPNKILQMWKGLGYNRRALNLHKAVKEIHLHHNGKFPQTEKELLALPGIGKYTARAIMVFAYEKDCTVIDTNIRQIIAHFFFDDIPQKENDIEIVAEKLLPAGKSWDWHQALMDYGALELVPDKTKRKIKKDAIPFKDTKRFMRGRIIDKLRETDSEEPKIIKEFSSLYNKSDVYISGIINDLEKDGLVCRDIDGTIHLPKD